MIEIDGSYGEGGGQILRTATAFSILTQTPIKVGRIRAKRPQPGLKPQHLTVLKILKRLSCANTEGLMVSSSTISFHPQGLLSGSFRFDVGTAGSVVLIAQTILLATLQTKQKISIELTGGTDVKWAPSWDYFTYVFIPFVRQMGLDVEVCCDRRGYYPKGGGRIRLIIHPHSGLHAMTLEHPSPVDTIKGRIHSHGLPDHIMTRMKHTVLRNAVKGGYDMDMKTEESSTISPGVVLTVWADSKDRFLGFVGLGERGVRAETIASTALERITDYIGSGATVDPYLFDQVLGFLMCANGKSRVIVPELSSHAKTNIWLIGQFMDITKCVKYTDGEYHVMADIYGQPMSGV